MTSDHLVGTLREDAKSATLTDSQFIAQLLDHDGQPISAEDKDLESLSKQRSDDDHFHVVDIGGERDIMLQDLRRMRPDLQGRLIVQDLAKEIDGREIVEGVERMTFDFIQLQPVKDASIYFLWHTFSN